MGFYGNLRLWGGMGVYEELKQALHDIVPPELRALQVEIKRLDEKIDIAIQIRERLAFLEAKVTSLTK